MDTKIEVQDVKGQVDKRNIYMLLGCYCNNPKAILQEESNTKFEDYPELFHNLIYGAILNIVKKGNINKITPIDVENEMSAFPNALEVWKINNGFEYLQSAIEDSASVVDNIIHYRDNVRKYSIIRNATSELKIDLSFLYNENDDKILSKFNLMTSEEVLDVINLKLIQFKETWSSDLGDAESFNISDDLESLIESFKTESGYGYPFQSGFLTRIFGGLEPKRYYMFGGSTGVGKSRLSMGDACDISTLGYYDWTNKTWISTGEEIDVLFISIELTKEEMQLFALAHISGVNPYKIKHWNLLSNEEQKIVLISKEILKRSKWHCKYMPEFDIMDIENTIEEYISKYHVSYVFFDYINECMKLLSSCSNKTKNVSLRVDQILFQLSQKLKMLSNKFEIPIVAGSQLITEEKSAKNNIWNQKDENDIKGSRAISQKLDCGCVIARVTDKELKALESIINLYKQQDFNFKEPNYVYNIYKGRGSDYNRVRIWLNIDLGCYRTKDCFVTDWYGKILEVESIKIDFDDTELKTFVESIDI